MRIKKTMKTMKIKILVLNLALTGVLSSSNAGTITISASGLSSSPIFVTSTLGSLSTGLELNIGTFTNETDLANAISTYKAGVVGTGNSLADAQTDAAAKGSLLYSQTVSWLSSASNFKSIVAVANSITQAGTTAAGKILFNNTASRTVNGVTGTWTGANGTMDVTYANFAPGAGAKLWAWFATGSEIAIVNDLTWVVPGTNVAGLTVGTAQLVSTGSGNPAELLLASYTDYSSGSDLISSVAVASSLNVVPEPSTGALMMIGAAGLVALRRLRKV
jgi:hypothetical protein